MQIKGEDFYWLVGLLEGEGAFMVNRCEIRMGSTDEDVVRKAAKILGATTYGPYTFDNPKRKPVWHASLAYASDWMKALYPFMGTRRKLQIKEALKHSKEYPKPEELKPLKIEPKIVGREIVATPIFQFETAKEKRFKR